MPLQSLMRLSPTLHPGLLRSWGRLLGTLHGREQFEIVALEVAGGEGNDSWHFDYENLEYNVLSLNTL